jgi:hypothetical protein
LFSRSLIILIDNQNAFRERLRERRASKLRRLSHRRSTSDSALLRLKLERMILHDGASFEIINPRDSLELARIVSSPEDQPRRSSENSPSDGEPESTISSSIRTVGANVSRRPSTAKSIQEEALKLSSSGSSSFGAKFPSATPGLLGVEDPFSALPRLTDLPGIPPHLIRPGSLDRQPSKRSFDNAIRALAIKNPSLLDSATSRVHQVDKSGRSGSKKLSTKIPRLFGKKSVERSKEAVDSGHEAGLARISRVNSKGSPLGSSYKRRSSLLSDASGDLTINHHQPNYNSACGRIDKSNTIEARIRRKPGRRTLRKQPSMLSINRAFQTTAVQSQSSSPPSSFQEESSASRGTDMTVESGSHVVEGDPVRWRAMPEDATYRANRFHSLHSMQSALVDGNATYRDIMEFFFMRSSPDSDGLRRLSEELSWLDLDSRHTSRHGAGKGDQRKRSILDDDFLLSKEDGELYHMSSISRLDEQANQQDSYSDSSGQLSVINSQQLRDFIPSATAIQESRQPAGKDNEQLIRGAVAQGSTETHGFSIMPLSVEKDRAPSHEPIQSKDLPLESQYQTGDCYDVEALLSEEIVKHLNVDSPSNQLDNTVSLDGATVAVDGEIVERMQKSILTSPRPNEGSPGRAETQPAPPTAGSPVQGPKELLTKADQELHQDKLEERLSDESHRRAHNPLTLPSFHRRPVYDTASVHYYPVHSSVRQRSGSDTIRHLYLAGQVHPAHRDLVQVEDQPPETPSIMTFPSSLPPNVRCGPIDPALSSRDPYHRYRAYIQSDQYQNITVPINPRRTPTPEIPVRPATSPLHCRPAGEDGVGPAGDGEKSQKLKPLRSGEESRGQVRHRPSRELFPCLSRWIKLKSRAKSYHF